MGLHPKISQYTVPCISGNLSKFRFMPKFDKTN